MSGEPLSGAVNARPRAVAVRFSQALLAIAAAYVAASLFASAFRTLGRTLGLSAVPELYAIQTVGQFVGFAIAAVLFVGYAGDAHVLRARVPTAADLVWGLGGTVALLVGQYALLFALAAVGVEVAENRALSPGEGAPRYFLYMVVVSVFVVGPGEELVFRGVVQGELRRALSAPGAIGVASALFGLVHFVAGTGTAVERGAYVVVALLLGGVLGYLYETRGTLVVPALAHGLYNAVLYGSQYADAVGLLG